VSNSKTYQAALEASKKVHKTKAFTGKFLRPHAAFIGEIIKRLGCTSILDYGCGKGQQYEWVIPSTGQTIEDLWGVRVTKYDPAYPPFAERPTGKFDLVICTQVLGTIPKPDIHWVIDDVYSYATKAVYVSERLGEARKEIADQSLRPFDWSVEDWTDALSREVPLEVTFASREFIGGEKITKHHRSTNGGAWAPVVWPENVKAMNHKWVP
jgi:hypothetical protein